jgi:hypothetical protein
MSEYREGLFSKAERFSNEKSVHRHYQKDWFMNFGDWTELESWGLYPLLHNNKHWNKAFIEDDFVYDSYLENMV